MAFQSISIGDILMLSQQAWKIGRAFSQGRTSAPVEFAEVEREANGLSEALKLTAETLHSDGSILSRAEPETRSAVNHILESAGRTLGDLESFVERYQVIRKRETGSGFVVERSWSEAIMANYKTIKWTTEGGTIEDLRNILHMHTSTINLTMQALQSRSLERLEQTVMPMAENISSIHGRVNGDLGDKIDDLLRIVMGIAGSTPSLDAQDRITKDSGSELGGSETRDRSSTISTLDEEYYEDGTIRMPQALPPRSSSFAPKRPPDRYPHDSAQSTPVLSYPLSRKTDLSVNMERPASARESGKRMDWDFETGSPPNPRGSIGDDLDNASSAPTSAFPKLSPKISNTYRRESSVPRRESTTLPNLFGAVSLDTVAGSSRESPPRYKNRAISYDEPSSPPSRSRPASDRLSGGQHVLPPPAIPPSPTATTPATPSSFFNRLSRSQSDANNKISRPQTAKSIKPDASPISPALLTLGGFKQSLFRNSAILCEVRGVQVEYAQHIPDEPDPRFNTEMVEACQKCRVCVIRKRENRAHGGTKLATSIWALSEDGTVRCQQKISDNVETVPYCSYFQQEKVSIPPSDDEIVLRFHGEKWSDDVEKEIKTNWVNYIFETESDAVTFQSAVFGRMLIGSFRTMKTTVIHDGLMGAFALEEQFANIEMLRLWEDDGVATPGAQGGVLALMHVSSNFGEGWARWWMNCSRQVVKIKGDGPKHVKLKGIDVIVARPGTVSKTADMMRNSSAVAATELQRVDTRDSGGTPVAKTFGKRMPVKRVAGIKIEFKDEIERSRFLQLGARVQDRIIPLPDL